jgi:NAD(P)-dependent dehydrogenase (short-subunit alcohol dehydrogenase family)
MSNEESKKVALVTGANRGIGLETVRQLAQQGIKVLLGARSQEKGEAAATKLRDEGLDVQAIQLDVDDLASHERAAKQIADQFGKLDILINNAGIYVDQSENGSFVPASRTPQDVWRKTFDTNFFNVISLTQTLIPLVRKAEAGRIVFLSSGLGSLTMHSDPSSAIYDWKVPAYDISKTALNGYVVHLAWELKDTPIKVNAAHPGSVLTDMNQNGTLSVEEGAKTSVALATLTAAGVNGKMVHLGEELPW